MRLHKIIYFLLILFALFSLYFSGQAYFARRHFLSRAIQAKGLIIGLEKQRKVYKPKVQYILSNDTITFVTPVGKSDTSQIKTGTEVEILYLPKKPKQAVIKDNWQIWYSPILTSLLGVLPLLFFMLIRWALVSKNKKD